jgi:hypothetical protein
VKTEKFQEIKVKNKKDVKQENKISHKTEFRIYQTIDNYRRIYQWI